MITFYYTYTLSEVYVRFHFKNLYILLFIYKMKMCRNSVLFFLFTLSLVHGAPISFKECASSNKMQLCSYSDNNITKCDGSPMQCQIMEPGVCIKHENCDSTGLCYVEVSFVDNTFTKISTKNYFGATCSANSLGFEQVFTIDTCIKVNVFNFTVYANVELIKNNNSSQSNINLPNLHLLLMSFILYILS